MWVDELKLQKRITNIFLEQRTILSFLESLLLNMKDTDFHLELFTLILKVLGRLKIMFSLIWKMSKLLAEPNRWTRHLSFLSIFSRQPTNCLNRNDGRFGWLWSEPLSLATGLGDSRPLLRLLYPWIGLEQ